MGGSPTPAIGVFLTTPSRPPALVSSVEGLVKPDRRLFHKALGHVRAKPREAVHVGDSLHEDYRGATRAGLAALLLDRHNPGPKGVRSIRTLHEVIDFVEEQ